MNETQPQSPSSETPLCDAEEYSAIANTNSALLADDHQYVVAADFARTLERALAEKDGRVREAVAVVAELVRLKDLHDKMEREKDFSMREVIAEYGNAADAHALWKARQQDYDTNKPLAWEAARRLLDEKGEG